MKISELSTKSGVPIPTLKFYLREGLLAQGRLSSPNQAEYEDSHLRRLALVRALRDIAGLSIAKIRAIVQALEEGEHVYEVMGAVVDSLGGDPLEHPTPAQERAAREVDGFLEKVGLPTRPESLARHQLIGAWASVQEMLFPGTPVEVLMPYAVAAQQVTAIENAATPGMFELDPEAAIEKAVLGLALFEPILTSFRRLYHERYAEERTDLAPPGRPPLPPPPVEPEVQIPRPGQR